MSFVNICEFFTNFNFMKFQVNISFHAQIFLLSLCSFTIKHSQMYIINVSLFKILKLLFVFPPTGPVLVDGAALQWPVCFDVL